MKLLEYEQSLKSRMTKDITDPQIYTDLQEMILMFLRRKHATRCYKDSEDLSHIIAGDLYIQLINKELNVEYYLGYLDKIYHSYVRDFYGESLDELPFDPSIDVNAEILGHPSTYDFVYARDKIYLQDIGKVIEYFLDRTCKYSEMSVYNNLEISLLLSVLRGRLVNFRLTDEQFIYLRLLVVRFYQEVKVNGFEIESSLCIEGSMNILS